MRRIFHNHPRRSDKRARSVKENAVQCTLLDENIEFSKSAFNHNIDREDILNALKTKIYDAAIGELPEKYAVIGFNRAGKLLEILYNPVDNNTISVFHAMRARKSFLKMLGLLGR
jgi:hypothetical protein